MNREFPFIKRFINICGGLLLATTASICIAAPAADGYRDLGKQPDDITVITEAGTVNLNGASGVWNGDGIQVTLTAKADGMQVNLTAPKTAVKKLRLHWQGQPEGKDWKYLGDTWERSYGDLEWKPLDGKRSMPWYFLASNGQYAHAYGVKTLPAALCCWKIDEGGVTLLADVRCGGKGVQLGERALDVCMVVSRQGKTGESPFAAAEAFCRLLCPHPRLPKQPVYGFNDWYCDYGNISADSVRQDTAFLARLAPMGGNRPYMVIDAGWQVSGGDSCKGQWDRGNAKFPDMAALAAEIVKSGIRPGIWLRLLVAEPGQPKNWKLPRDHAYLDPSVPEVRAYVKATIKHLRGWGFELIKHDFSTIDLTGGHGSQMGDEVTADGWAFTDRTRTTAEIIIDFYRSIREAAGDDAVVIGCTTMGHLSAGIFEISRTGDDTSGKEWDRVRKMGVNTLAFRMPQNNTFFAVDADCVGQTKTSAIPWEKNRQWLDLLAHSGTPLFVSFKRDSVTPEQEQTIKAALAIASRPMPSGEPLDWFNTRQPARWKLFDGEHDFAWSDPRPGSAAK